MKYFSYLKTVKDYNGGRTEADFVKFLKDPSAPTQEKAAAEPFGDFPGSEKIIIMGDKNADEVLQNEDRLLVMFYAPWCGHCKRMKPDFAEVASMLVKNHVPGKVAAIDCTEHPKTAERFEIQGYPTMKYFVQGKFIKNYEGKRTAQAMFEFIRSNGANQKDELWRGSMSLDARRDMGLWSDETRTKRWNAVVMGLLASDLDTVSASV